MRLNKANNTGLVLFLRSATFPKRILCKSKRF